MKPLRGAPVTIKRIGGTENTQGIGRIILPQFGDQKLPPRGLEISQDHVAPPLCPKNAGADRAIWQIPSTAMGEKLPKAPIWFSLMALLGTHSVNLLDQ